MRCAVRWTYGRCPRARAPARFFPTETALRVLDATFMWGTKVLLAATVAFVKLHEDELIAMDDALESCELMKQLASKAMDPDVLIAETQVVLEKFPDSALMVLRDRWWKEQSRHSRQNLVSRSEQRLRDVGTFERGVPEQLMMEFMSHATVAEDQPIDYLAITLDGFKVPHSFALQSIDPTTGIPIPSHQPRRTHLSRIPISLQK